MTTEHMTLADALAYLKPDPSNNGTISLRASKARQAVEIIEAEIAAFLSRKASATSQWRITGKTSCGLGAGHGTTEWFNSSIGVVQSFPTHFNPNNGQYEGMSFTTGRGGSLLQSSPHIPVGARHG